MKRTSAAKRTALSPLSIAACAIDLADREGLEDLSMRKIAKKLGVEAMSLYHHVPSKAKLMEAMVAKLVDELPQATKDLPWRHSLTQAAHHWRHMAQRHPGTFPLLAVRAQMPPGLLERYAALLTVLTDAGLTPGDAARALSSFVFGLNGYLLAAGEPVVFRDIPEPKDFPLLSNEATTSFAAIPPEVWDFASDAAFSRHLDFLLAGVGAAVDSRTT